MPGVVAVFEVPSPDPGRIVRIVELHEYGAVPSILCYVIPEHRSAGLSVFGRADGGDPWTAHPLTGEDVLRLPEIGIEVPVAEFHEGVEFGDGGAPLR